MGPLGNWREDAVSVVLGLGITLSVKSLHDE